MSLVEAFQLVRSSMVDAPGFLALQAALAGGGRLRLAVASSSMEPCIRAGETVEIRSFTREPRRFDIVVYWNGANLVCHLFWHRNQDRRDDASLFVARALAAGIGEDTAAPLECMLGHVVSHRLSFRQKLGLVIRAKRGHV